MDKRKNDIKIESEFEEERDREKEREKEEEIDESYLQELYKEKKYECVVESLEIFKEYVYEKGLPIGEKLTIIDLFEFFFE